MITGLSAQVDELQSQLADAATVLANATRFHDATVAQMESLKKRTEALELNLRRFEGENDELHDQLHRALGIDHLDGRERRVAARSAVGAFAPRDEAGVNLPPPKFSGASSKDALKVTSWLPVFENWAALRRLSSTQKALAVTCSLEGAALNVWNDLQARIIADGLDLSSWEVVKSALLTHYSEVAPERTVRSRLSSLSQTGTVQAFHSSFRAICAEAVKHPVVGAEATYHFLTGLKPALQQACAVDPSTGAEWESLDKLVAYAKNIEPVTYATVAAALTGNACPFTLVKGKGQKRKGNGAGPSYSSPSAGGGPSKAAKRTDLPVAREVFQARVDRNQCGLCGAGDHKANACPRSARSKDVKGKGKAH